MTSPTPEQRLREKAERSGGQLSLTMAELCGYFGLPLTQESVRAIDALLDSEHLTAEPSLAQVEPAAEKRIEFALATDATAQVGRPARARKGSFGLAVLAAVIAAGIATALVLSGDDEDIALEEHSEQLDQEIVDGELTVTGRATVADARQAFAMTVLDGSRYRATLRGVENLIRLCREAPLAIYETDGETLTLRQVVEDGANTLRRYVPDEAAKLEQVANNDCR